MEIEPLFRRALDRRGLPRPFPGIAVKSSENRRGRKPRRPDYSSSCGAFSCIKSVSIPVASLAEPDRALSIFVRSWCAWGTSRHRFDPGTLSIHSWMDPPWVQTMIAPSSARRTDNLFLMFRAARARGGGGRPAPNIFAHWPAEAFLCSIGFLASPCAVSRFVSHRPYTNGRAVPGTELIGMSEQIGLP